MVKNKVIIIVGGAGLIGKAFAKAIIEQGGIAVIADKDIRSAKKWVLSENTPRAVCLPIDITDVRTVNAVIAQVARRYKKIDALVNAAYPKNKHYGRTFEAVTYKDFCENINMHLGGYFLVSQRIALFFKKQGYGNIIHIASIYGTAAPRFEIYKNTHMTMPVEYAAIKAGIIQLTKYMARYFQGNKLRVNCISPGGILNQQPKEFIKRYNQYGLSKGMLSVDDLIGALLYLLSDMSIAMNGQNIVIDDGWTL